MKQKTEEKFVKWCRDIGAVCHDGFVNNENDFPSYYIHDKECIFRGKYDEGFFILKLLDYNEKTSTGAANGIEIRELVWNEEYEDYRWYAEDEKSNIYNRIIRTDLSKNGIKSIQGWLVAHTTYPKFPNFNISDFIYLVKDFIYKVDESKTLKVESDYDSIDNFFDSDFMDGDSLAIKAVNVDITLITIEKVIINEEEMFKFIVDISTDENDEFKIKTTFDSQEKFKSLLEATINALKEYKEFYKYAEDLENCL
jgi:hypothetical protein